MAKDFVHAEPELAAAEAGKIRIRGVGANRYAALVGCAHSVIHSGCIAGVKSARDICGRNEIKQRGIFPAARGAEPLA